MTPTPTGRGGLGRKEGEGGLERGWGRECQRAAKRRAEKACIVYIDIA